MLETCSSIGIYSVGLLGGSLARSFRSRGFGGKIIGFSSPSALQYATSNDIIDRGYEYNQLAEQINSVNVLFLCSPIEAICNTLKQICTMKITTDLLISDIGSTKSQIMQQAMHLPPGAHFIGAHPMAGSEKSGVTASNELLFENAAYIITPQQPQASELEQQFGAFLQKYLGCSVLYMDAKTHDEVVATVSHVPHLISVALAELGYQQSQHNETTLQLAAGSFRDMTRIATASWPMWRDIFSTNQRACKAVLSDYIRLLQGMLDQIGSESMQHHFDRARITREQLPFRHKGISSQLHDVLVAAPDRVGILQKIATLCSDNNINIKDFEVQRVREDILGTVRFSFESEQTAQKAAELFSRNGFVSTYLKD